MRGTWALSSRRLRSDGCPDPSRPVAGEELVGSPAEQERVGALVGLGDERPGLVVARPQGPSAALEPAPSVLIRCPAVSLHHAIDGDLRLGRQLHGRGPLLVVLITVRYDRTTAPNSIGHRGVDADRDRRGGVSLLL